MIDNALQLCARIELVSKASKAVLSAFARALLLGVIEVRANLTGASFWEEVEV